MKARSAFLASLVLVLVVAACAGGGEISSWRGADPVQQQGLIRGAEEFMADYARRIRAGDRAGIAALYDSDGALLVRGGRRLQASHADIVRRYARPEWQAPTSFDWRDLHFEAVGPDSVIVLGKFAWQGTEGPAEIGTYNALLRRDGDRLVIRIEDEASDQSGG